MKLRFLVLPFFLGVAMLVGACAGEDPAVEQEVEEEVGEEGVTEEGMETEEAE